MYQGKLLRSAMAAVALSGASLIASVAHGAAINLTPAIPDVNLSSGSLSYVFTDYCFQNDGIGPSGPCGTGGGGPNGFGGALDPAASSGVLTLSGTAMTLLSDSGFYLVTDHASTVLGFNLTANFSGAGVYQGGTISVYGTTTDPNFGSGTLLTATLADATDHGEAYPFGFSGTGNAGTFEFVFDNVGGDFAAYGNAGGVIIGAFSISRSPAWSGAWDPLSNSNPAFWQDDFSSTLVTADAFVPVPAAVWLLGSALSVLGWIRRRRLH
jgi:hypothetical protein